QAADQKSRQDEKDVDTDIAAAQTGKSAVEQYDQNNRDGANTVYFRLIARSGVHPGPWLCPEISCQASGHPISSGSRGLCAPDCRVRIERRMPLPRRARDDGLSLALYKGICNPWHARVVAR